MARQGASEPQINDRIVCLRAQGGSVGVGEKSKKSSAKKEPVNQAFVGQSSEKEKPHDKRVREPAECEDEGDVWSRGEKERRRETGRNNRGTKGKNRSNTPEDLQGTQSGDSPN